MIRDPSDGTVRELTAEEDRLVWKSLFDSGTVIDTMTSGLPLGIEPSKSLKKGK